MLGDELTWDPGPDGDKKVGDCKYKIILKTCSNYYLRQRRAAQLKHFYCFSTKSAYLINDKNNILVLLLFSGVPTDLARVARRRTNLRVATQRRHEAGVEVLALLDLLHDLIHLPTKRGIPTELVTREGRLAEVA